MRLVPKVLEARGRDLDGAVRAIVAQSSRALPRTFMPVTSSGFYYTLG